nr:Ig-like domain-containing protein [Mannheimia granulomatis]
MSGNVANAKAGDKVLLSIGSIAKEVDIGSNGDFSLLVSGETLINHRSISAGIVTKDEAGNTATASAKKAYEVDIDPPAPTLTLDKVTGDNVVGLGEQYTDRTQTTYKDITITGNIGNVEASDNKNLVLMLCGCTQCANSRKVLENAKLTEDGQFSVDVSPEELKKYTSVVAVLNTSDKAGNKSEELVASQDYTVDLQIYEQKPTIKLNPIATDNNINGSEYGQTIKITGSIDKINPRQASVKLQFIKDGKVVTEVAPTFDKIGTTVTPNFSYSISGKDLHEKYDTVTAVLNAVVPVLKDGRPAMEPVPTSSTQKYMSSPYSPTWNSLNLVDVSENNVIDSQETQQATTIVLGNYSVNLNQYASNGVGVYVNLQLKVNDKLYTKRMDGVSGNFEIEVATKDLIADQDKILNLTATVHDTAGNTGQSKTATLPYQVQDTHINQPEVTIDAITTINQAYVVQNPTTRVSGTVKVDGDVPEANQTVSLTVNNQEYNVIRKGDTWFVDVETSALVAANGNISAKVKATDLSNNSAENSAMKAYIVDVTPPAPKSELNKIGEDNVLTAGELSQDVVVSGKVSGDYNATDKVKLQIGATTYEVPITDGTFSQMVNAYILRANSYVSASIESTDIAGNVGKAEASQDYQVQAVDIQIKFANVTTDNLINVTERFADEITISGQLTGKDAQLGKTVLLTINGAQYATTVGNDLSFTLNVSGKTLLDNPNYRIDAQVLDSSLQVQATKSHQYQVQDRAAADIHITNVGDDAFSVNQVYAGVRVGGKLNFNDSV